jgi:DNA-directed RNA polymerase specialized sigma24 family protein
MADTADLVQDAILNTLQRLHTFEPQGHGALRAYLRRAVENRINDEHRRIARRGVADELDEAAPDRWRRVSASVKRPSGTSSR